MFNDSIHIIFENAINSLIQNNVSDSLYVQTNDTIPAILENDSIAPIDSLIQNADSISSFLEINDTIPATFENDANVPTETLVQNEVFVPSLPQISRPIQTIIENDSIAPIDSLTQNNDSVPSFVQIIAERFDGILPPSLPHTENWVFGTLLALFFLLVICIRLYPSFIYEDIRSIFRVKERSSIFSNPEASDLRLRFLYLFFSYCVISLYVYFVLFQPDSGDFSFGCYPLFLGATIGFFLVKYLFVRLLNYVFFDTNKGKIAIESYNNILILFGILLFPLLILNIYSPPLVAQIAQIASLVLCLAAAVLAVFKLFQIFYSKLFDFFYILLYLCTLEILPILVLFQVYRAIVSC